MLEEEDDGFVTINLDSSRCDICQLDTGEDLVPCNVCRQEISNSFMKSGFNELPTHADIQAHKGCLWKEHQIMQTSPCHSPYAPSSPYICSSPVLGSPVRSRSNSIFDLMNGTSSGRYSSAPSSPRHRSVSQPATPTRVQKPDGRRRFTLTGSSPLVENTLNPTTGQKCRSSEELNKDAFNSKLRKLLRKAKKKEMFENKRNDSGLSVHSSPATRCHSPILGSNVGQGIDYNHGNSERNPTVVRKDADPRYLALRQSYVRYLFGKCVFPKPDVSFTKQKQTSTQVKVPVLRNTSTVDGVVKPGAESKTRHFNNNNDSDNDDNKSTNEQQMKSNKQQDTPKDVETAKRVKENLITLSSNQLHDKLEAMNTIIKDISNELVDLLEERDDLRREVNMRHLTIEKLVQKEKALRAACST